MIKGLFERQEFNSESAMRQLQESILPPAGKDNFLKKVFFAFFQKLLSAMA